MSLNDVLTSAHTAMPPVTSMSVGRTFVFDTENGRAELQFKTTKYKISAVVY